MPTPICWKACSNGVAPQLASAKRLRVDLGGRARNRYDWRVAAGKDFARRRAGRPSRCVTGIDERHAELIEDVRRVNRGARTARPRQNPVLARLEQAGRTAFSAVGENRDLPADAWSHRLGAVRHAAPAALAAADLAGLPDLADRLAGYPDRVLITFLIGAIIAQQGIFHFRKFGAESYVVDMVASSCCARSAC